MNPPTPGWRDLLPAPDTGSGAGDEIQVVVDTGQMRLLDLETGNAIRM
jgi:hypothetical protein